MKVINKSKLCQREAENDRQALIREIKIQRLLNECPNTIKLLSIYESDDYINLLLEFQEGGSLS